MLFYLCSVRNWYTKRNTCRLAATNNSIHICAGYSHTYLDSKVHGANMGPTWVLSAPDGPHVGPMNLTIKQSSWDQYGAHLGPVGPRWISCWPHEPCYQGMLAQPICLSMAQHLAVVDHQQLVLCSLRNIVNDVCTRVANCLCAHKRVILVFISRVA